MSHQDHYDGIRNLKDSVKHFNMSEHSSCSAVICAHFGALSVQTYLLVILFFSPFVVPSAVDMLQEHIAHHLLRQPFFLPPSRSSFFLLSLSPVLKATMYPEKTCNGLLL